jgi:DNA-binding sugar fermentation-stimulating protein
MEIFKIDKVYTTIVTNRPSKINKSPYLVDIIDPVNKSKIVLCHTPSLGMCGLIKEDSKVKVSKKDTNALSKYSLDILIMKEKNHNIYIGANPNYANKMVKYMLENNLVKGLENLEKIKIEYTIKNTRLDFFCNDNIYIEVKNIVLAAYEDGSKKDLKNKVYDNIPYDNKIAIFPDGYRKKSINSISPRALKHIKLLKQLAIKNNKCYMIYIIQRDDVKFFTISILDKEYRDAVIDAINNGVIVIGYKIKWINNKAYLISELPLIF